jgi:hypothetical protein
LLVHESPELNCGYPTALPNFRCRLGELRS